MSELEVLFSYNCSTIFLLYPLGIDRARIKEVGFVQAYLADSEKTDVEYNNPVFLLFKPDSMTLFQAYVESEYGRTNKHTGTIDLVEDYDYIDGYVVMVYQFPKEFEEEYAKFLDGKYSKFSKKFKEIYPKTRKMKMPDGRVIEEVSGQLKIVNKTKDLVEMLERIYDVTFDKEDELWSKPSIEKETLSYEKIKKMEEIK